MVKSCANCFCWRRDRADETSGTCRADLPLTFTMQHQQQTMVDHGRRPGPPSTSVQAIAYWPPTQAAHWCAKWKPANVVEWIRALVS